MSNQFSGFAKKWWDLNGPIKALHTINRPRFKFITQHVKLQHKQVLDLGCGGGILAEILAKSGANITGVDISSELILAAKQHCPNDLKINYIVDSFGQYSDNLENHSKFDIITCMELLEHIDDPCLLISSCNRLLKSGGKLFLSTLNRTIKSYVFGIIGAEYVLNLVPRGTHQYGNFIKPSELKTLLKKENIELDSISGIKYNPITNVASLIQGVDINYIIYASSK